MNGYKNYIRTQLIGIENIVIHRFSTGFLKEAGGNEEILPGDICVNEDGSRQYNEPWISGDGQYLYKWDGTDQIERTSEELFDLINYKQQKISELTVACNAQLIAGFSSNATGTTINFGFDELDQAYLQEKAVLMGIDQTTSSIDWKTKQGFITLTRTQFFQVVIDGGAHKENLVRERMYLEELVLNAPDKLGVDGINW